MVEISVIIPVYNTEKYIKDCLESLCNSTVFNKCEIIVIDDGSTDHSVEIVEEYIKKHGNVSLYSYANMGLSSARNKGLEQAKGKYIFFVDSDDFIENDYLQKLYEAIEKEDVDVVFAGFTNVNANGQFKTIEKRKVLHECNVLSGCDYLEKRMDAEDWSNQVWCAIYKRKFLIQHHIQFDENVMLYEDILFTNVVLLLAEKVYAVPQYGYMYRTRENSLVHEGISQKDVDNLLLILEKFMNSWSYYTVIQKHAAGRMYFQLLSMLLYDIGVVNPFNKKMYYQRIENSGVMKALRESCTCRKEKIKVFIFKSGLHWYYQIIRMKEKVLWKKKKNQIR